MTPRNGIRLSEEQHDWIKNYIAFKLAEWGDKNVYDANDIAEMTIDAVGAITGFEYHDNPILSDLDDTITDMQDSLGMSRFDDPLYMKALELYNELVEFMEANEAQEGRE